MKKILKYLLILLCIILVLPAVFTKQHKKIAKEERTENETIEENMPKYEYSKFATINLYHTKTSITETLPIDEYLYGVVSAEMPANYEEEALKAQAVVARTYTLYQIQNSNGKHENGDICDDYKCCQAWISKNERFEKWDENEAESNWNKIVKAVDTTQGQIITYKGNPIDAFFHSNSGGTTETASNVWGGNDFPYLQSIETAGEEGYSQYNSEVILTKEEAFNKIKEKYQDFQINFEEQDSIKILEYTQSGRVKTIKFGNIELAGTEARTLFGLKSTNFTIRIDNNNVIFEVKGYGHGVGMSQTGADNMAKQGATYEEIIKHFYTGVELKYINEVN